MKTLQALTVLNVILLATSLLSLIVVWVPEIIVADSMGHLAANVFLGGVIFTSINLLGCMIISIIETDGK